MSKAERGSKAASNRKPASRFPWIAFLLLLATIYFFWIYPLQKSRPPVRVTFEPATSSTK